MGKGFWENCWNDERTLKREFDIEETEVECERLKKLVEDLEEGVEKVKENIVREDNKRELYSLDPVKVSKVSLPTFGGQDHEDFSKFKEDIKEGFRTNRTSKKEQIIKLRENWFQIQMLLKLKKHGGY